MPSGFASLPASPTTSVCSLPGSALNLRVQEVLFFLFFPFFIELSFPRGHVGGTEWSNL